MLEGERSVSNPLNVASLMVLAISTICFGKDVLAKGYLADGIRMAEGMGLLGGQRQAVEYFGGASKDMLSMLCYAAWGAFNFSS